MKCQGVDTGACKSGLLRSPELGRLSPCHYTGPQMQEEKRTRKHVPLRIRQRPPHPPTDKQTRRKSEHEARASSLGDIAGRTHANLGNNNGRLRTIRARDPVGKVDLLPMMTLRFFGIRYRHLYVGREYVLEKSKLQLRGMCEGLLAAVRGSR